MTRARFEELAAKRLLGHPLASRHSCRRTVLHRGDLVAAHGFGPTLWETSDSDETRGIPDGRGATFDQTGDDGKGSVCGTNWKDALQGWHGPSFGFEEFSAGTGAAHVSGEAGIDTSAGGGFPKNR